MRITPTQEQMVYLVSIGISMATISQPWPLIATSSEDTHTTFRWLKDRLLQWWVVILMIILLLLAMSTFVRAGDRQHVGHEAVAKGGLVKSGGDTTTTARIDTSNELLNARGVIGHGVIQGKIDTLREQIRNIGNRQMTVQIPLVGDVPKDRKRKAQHIQNDPAKLKPNMSEISAVQRGRTEEIAALATSPMEKTDSQFVQTRHAWEAMVEKELDTLRRDFDQQSNNYHRALIWFFGSIILGIGLLITERILMENRIRQVELTGISSQSDKAIVRDDVLKPSQKTNEDSGVKGGPTVDKKVQVDPRRQNPQPLPTPIEQMTAFIAAANRLRSIRVKPELPSGKWGMGLATHKGNVRSENQDYGLCFTTGAHNVLIVADGCGGVPHGQKAAYLAATSAAASVMRAYGTAPRWHTPHVREVASRAIIDAAHRLAVEGDKLNIADIRGGLRTTLIVVVAGKSETGYAYIGDGGGCVVKVSGEVMRFLDPQKASEFGLNVLAASLGPVMEGEPVTGVMNRDPGDLLIVGTDGIFDRVDGAFPKDVLRGCIQYKGDIQKTVEHVVEELAEFKDKAGYICDDNLTLGAVGDGTTPKLAQGFWSPFSVSQAAHHDTKPTDVATSLKESVR